MGSDEVGEANGVVAVVLEEQLEGVHHDQDELDHLHDREVLLPPQVLLHLGAHRGQHVVGVHEDVHEGVQESKEGRVAAGRELDAPPDGHGHDAVVDHVQRGHLVVPLAHHEEERVEELGELGEVVPPATLSGLKRKGVNVITKKISNNNSKH